MIRKLFRRTSSVASIMASFHKQIGQLEALHEQKLNDAATKHNEAKALRDQASERTGEGNAAYSEARAADNMAGKLRDFVGQ